MQILSEKPIMIPAKADFYNFVRSLDAAKHLWEMEIIHCC